MRFLKYILLITLLAGDVSAQLDFLNLFGAKPSPFDYNGDGVIRCAILGTSESEQQVDSALTCQDLEQMISGSRPGMPVRVTFEEIKETKTVMGWWYHPDCAGRRSAFTSAAYDYVFVVENESVITKYPALFFEGLHITRTRFDRNKTRVMLLMMDSPPASSVWDNSVEKLTELSYRVGDGCDVPVIPAAWAWRDVMRHHILPGRSLLKKRANSFLAASAIWCQIAGESVPKAALTTDWVVRKTALQMARSAEDAVVEALRLRHYSRPFEGVVRMDNRDRQHYLFYHAGSMGSSALRDALGFIAASDGKSTVQYSLSDWYESGFDRYSCPLDLVYGSLQEMEPLLEGHKYTSAGSVPLNIPEPVRVVYNRNPPNDESGELTLRTLEQLLMDGYAFAKKSGVAFVPYQVAWARLWSINPEYVKPAPGKSTNDWLNYMLAGMIYSAMTGQFLEAPEINRPLIYNDVQPRGYHRIAARTGWQCMRQLSSLKLCGNAILSVGSGWQIDAANPAFIRVRLLEQPLAPVKILCASVNPSALQLSRAEFTFDSSNFDIEQVARCSPTGSGTNLFCDVLISAQSADRDIDGFSKRHTFLLNPLNGEKAAFIFSKTELAPGDQSIVTLRPDTRPVEPVYVSILQNGVETASICFSPHYYQEHPVRLFPDADAIAAGGCEVTLKVHSRDRRFDGYEKRRTFRLAYSQVQIPTVRILSPRNGEQIDGPAFVSAEASVANAPGDFEVFLFCGRKLLGAGKGATLKAGVEMGPPLSRLGPGEYPLWAAVRLKSGVAVSSEVIRLKIK